MFKIMLCSWLRAFPRHGFEENAKLTPLEEKFPVLPSVTKEARCCAWKSTGYPLSLPQVSLFCDCMAFVWDCACSIPLHIYVFLCIFSLFSSIWFDDSMPLCMHLMMTTFIMRYTHAMHLVDTVSEWETIMCSCFVPHSQYNSMACFLHFLN